MRLRLDRRRQRTGRRRAMAQARTRGRDRARGLGLSVDALGGQVAIVTGAGRGFGRAIAKGLAANGAAVALMARSRDDLDAVAHEIELAGGRSFAAPANVTDRAAVERAVKDAEAAL